MYRVIGIKFIYRIFSGVYVVLGLDICIGLDIYCWGLCVVSSLVEVICMWIRCSNLYGRGYSRGYVLGEYDIYNLFHSRPRGVVGRYKLIGYEWSLHGFLWIDIEVLDIVDNLLDKGIEFIGMECEGEVNNLYIGWSGI